MLHAPWTLSVNLNDTEDVPFMEYCVEDEEGNIVGFFRDRDEAYLVATAPELLKELELLVANHETSGASDSYGEASFSPARLTRVKDLITKAKGKLV